MVMSDTPFSLSQPGPSGIQGCPSHTLHAGPPSLLHPSALPLPTATAWAQLPLLPLDHGYVPTTLGSLSQFPPLRVGLGGTCHPCALVKPPEGKQALVK